MQRFNPSPSWDAATAASVGYEAVVRGVESQAVSLQSPLAGNQVSNVAALGVAISFIRSTQRPLRVVDFGGGGGQHADLATFSFPAARFDWTVVELADVVQKMQARSRAGLAFVTDLDSTLGTPTDIAFASASLNYVPEPLALLKRLVNVSTVTILTRLPLWPISEHQVAVQRAQRKPLDISYPTWFFSETRFLTEVAAIAEILLDFTCPNDRAAFAGHYGSYRGLVLARRTDRHSSDS